ncbi:tryptase-2 isoform X2 [Ovis canadensis]|uniref:tryptase-2 isoform X2 n=1 Tax=Ovis canadensis TaxID=37174 RepID=UPI0037533F2A
MALRSSDNEAPLMVELTSQITARDGYGTTWRNRVCWCGRGWQGPFLTRWTHSGLSHPLPPPLPWIGGPAPSSDPVVVCEDKGAERAGWARAAWTCQDAPSAGAGPPAEPGLRSPWELQEPSDLRVQLREQHLYYQDRLLPISRVIPHPHYYMVENGADIALLQLEEPVSISRHVQPVTLPPASETFPPESQCWVTGWGDVDNGRPLPPPYPLKQVKVPIVENSVCDWKYHSGLSTDYSVPIVQEDNLCAGDGGRDSCQGDSGGPLVCKVNGTWLQAGVVSWGDGCAKPNRPGIYTRVTSYLDWIHQYVPQEP